MIKYNLKCSNEHEFESWFLNSKEFDNLKKKNLLECIFCSSKKINKSIMAPMISGSKKINNEIKFKNMNLQNKKDQLLKLRNFIENNFEYVGKNFSRKVREVYYDKKNNKTISIQRKECSTCSSTASGLLLKAVNLIIVNICYYEVHHQNN